jgi:hypothetical protein
MRWGDRALEAEVIDGRARTTLSLGDAETDDFVIAQGARLHFTWRDDGLEVRFSTGVAGTGALKGDAPVALGQLVERGVVKEGPEGFTLKLGAGDALALQVAGQTIEVREARGRIARLRVDVFATLGLVLALTLLVLWVISTFNSMSPLNLIPK